MIVSQFSPTVCGLGVAVVLLNDFMGPGKVGFTNRFILWWIYFGVVFDLFKDAIIKKNMKSNKNKKILNLIFYQMFFPGLV